MTPQIIKTDNYIEVIGHYDDKVLCAKMTLLADLYAVEHRDGYAKFRVEDEEKLKAVDGKLEFGETWVINESPSSDVNITWYINYKSNNITYSVIYIEAVPMGCQIKYNNNTVHTSAPPMGDPIWFDENGNQTTYALTPYKTVTFETAPTGDLLTWLQANAVKQQTGYTITYETNGGTSVPQATGQTALPNPLPTTTKTGYAFDGWYTDSTLTTPAVAGASISQNTTLYAKWKKAIDLTTLPSASALLKGNHKITVKAKGANIKESNYSKFAIWNKQTDPPVTITPSFTNVTCSPSSATQVARGGSQSFSLGINGTSYKLPTSITVAGTSVSAGVETVISGKCTVLFSRGSDTSGSIAFSNVADDVSFSVVGESAIVYPTKGQLITMELGNATPTAGTNNQYRVLSINGSIAEVVAMYDMPDIKFTSTLANTYGGGELDTYLNTTFYNSLSSTAKSAIVDKNITQYQYDYNNSVYNKTTHASYADYSTKASKAVVGSRHVYALDIEDIETYFNSTFSTANIRTLFWNTTSAPSTVTNPWLRSAIANNSRYAWFVYGDYGRVGSYDVDGDLAARPALTIDLSKISWS